MIVSIVISSAVDLRHLIFCLYTDETDLTETVLKRAAKAVGSLSEKEFNISFNPDLYQSKVTHAEPDSDAMKTDKAMLNKITEFLVFHQIPAFVSRCSCNLSCNQPSLVMLI